MQEETNTKPGDSSQSNVPQPTYGQSSLPAESQMQVGMSASQLGLSTSHTSGFEWGTLVKKVVILGVVLLVLGGGFLLIKNSLTGLSTKTLTNSGYTYTFKFNKSAN